MGLEDGAQSSRSRAFQGLALDGTSKPASWKVTGRSQQEVKAARVGNEAGRGGRGRIWPYSSWQLEQASPTLSHTSNHSHN